MKKLILLFVIGCGSASPTDVPDADTYPKFTSVCFLPQKDIGVECSDLTPDNQTWGWEENNQNGQQFKRCNEAPCPSGAMCEVQSDVSGQSSGTLLYGSCE